MNTRLSYNEALHLFRAGQLTRAADQCREILRGDPNVLQASHLLARIAYLEDRYQDCIACLEPVVAANPVEPGLLLEYGAALRLAKRPGDALGYLRKVLDLMQTHAVYLELGLALADANELDEARVMLNRAVELESNCTVSMTRLGHIARQAGRFDEAIGWYRKIVNISPDSIHSYPELIKAYLSAGEPRDALEACERCLALEPACTGAFGLKYIALCELEDFDAVKYMLDFDHHIRVIAAECPESFDSIRDFNNYFSHYVLTGTEKAHVPEKYTTKNGWQTENGTLFNNNKRLGMNVSRMINAAVEDYISMLPVDPLHPVSKGTPSSRHIEPWCVVLYRDGHQAPHIHPKSWLSGAYYIQLPGDFDAQPEPNAGHIVFGQGDYDLHPLHRPATKAFKPAEGSCVIFPSYAWHHTVPLMSTDTRICMAFDIVPTKGWGR